MVFLKTERDWRLRKPYLLVFCPFLKTFSITELGACIEHGVVMRMWFWELILVLKLMEWCGPHFESRLRFITKDLGKTKSQHHVLFLANIWVCSWRLSVDIGNHAYMRSFAYTFVWFFGFYRICNHALFLHPVLVSFVRCLPPCLFYFILYLEWFWSSPISLLSHWQTMRWSKVEWSLVCLFYALFWFLASSVFLCFFWCVWGDEHFNWVKIEQRSPW